MDVEGTDPILGRAIDKKEANQQPGGANKSPHLPPPPTVGAGGAASIRPSSMAERARLAKLPQPEAALKCPRCDSTDTKFCYFNNYSLSQPRHFCKACRRYWTRGGALRNVPVGGGCRRTKISKGRRSKSLITAPNSAVSSDNCTRTDIMGHFSAAPSQLPLLPSLHHLTDFGDGDIGLNFGSIRPPLAVMGGESGDTGGADMEFQLARLADQLRLQQVQHFPFVAGLEPPNGLYQFEGEGVVPPYDVVGATATATAAAQLGTKPFDSGVNYLVSYSEVGRQSRPEFIREFLGVSGNDLHQYWGGNMWTDLSGFTSSSTSHLL
ncbi:unnamed protein product [Ilex paraguariensis]|uniref:Dof zinc finger protein n=1 Tax=Ilex paraguariensis TaxID=185542 RepID=A0ABC8UKA5_9AQUA